MNLEIPGVSNNTTGTLEQKKTNSWTPVGQATDKTDNYILKEISIFLMTHNVKQHFLSKTLMTVTKNRVT